MNENTRNQLDATTPAASRPVDKLRLAETPAADGPGASPASNCAGTACIGLCFADDE